MTETKIYIGLNDGETKAQRFETSKYLSILKRVCFSYHVAFSVHTQEGGYFHENGTYTQENSLVLSLIDVPEEVTAEIAQDLCAFFRQESVLVTLNEIKAYFVQETL